MVCGARYGAISWWKLVAGLFAVPDRHGGLSGAHEWAGGSRSWGTGCG